MNLTLWFVKPAELRFKVVLSWGSSIAFRNAILHFYPINTRFRAASSMSAGIVWIRARPRRRWEGFGRELEAFQSDQGINVGM